MVAKPDLLVFTERFGGCPIRLGQVHHRTAEPFSREQEVFVSETITLKVSEVIWRKDLYPRFEPIPDKVQQYAECVELLPPIEVNQNNELIDGYHRWTAHRKKEKESIKAVVTETENDADLYALGCERNAHGKVAISKEERKSAAIRMYTDGTGRTEEKIAETLHVKIGTIKSYLARTKKESKARRNKRIWDAWLGCNTESEIADKESLTQQAISEIIENYKKTDAIQKLVIFSAYQDPDWKPPIYDVWKRQSKSSKISHPGNSEALWLDNLLYMYTDQFDIIIDPFGGGGSTIDVCKKRLRRYWVSDRLPIVERLDMRQWDILDGPPPLHKRWSDVALLFLDPPYWKQTKGEYSQDKQDLANMDLETFYTTLVHFVATCAAKMKIGTHIAMLMQPTQWKAPNKQVIDHVIDLIVRLQDASFNLEYVRRVSCPYESQQANAQMVNWAKDNREILVLSRELIIWKVV
jgi:ParB-like chromosome segregation protein Spo0J